ncbi:MAG: NlpC/P60 family protein [Armatimonadetes bacterium]|nr:NlpC/P60 family protein [Armatimonadota bacterium]MDW8121192.1 NlpC/P60 family protein [Armatimonadota bacterium]
MDSQRTLCLSLAKVAIWFLIGIASSQSFRPYTAREGETLKEVAQRFNTTVGALIKVNPSLSESQALRQGEVLLVPTGGEPKSGRSPKGPTKSKPKMSTSSPSATAFWIYRVQPGDTLQTIAAQFGISVDLLASANGIDPRTVVVPSQVLQVPVIVVSDKKESFVSPQATLSHTQTPTPTQKISYQTRQRPPILPAPNPFGQIGIVSASSATIYSRPSFRSRIWSRCARGTRVIITDQQGNWWGILMVNGATGWVPKWSVQTQGQEVSWSEILSAFGAVDSGHLRQVVSDALRYLGIPYRYGGHSPTTGMDCSAFVRTVFAARGIYLPRTSREQVRYGQPVALSDLKPGDRLYFANKNGTINHTGIYIGNGLFIHASGRHGAVTISSLSELPYARSLVAIRR